MIEADSVHAGTGSGGTAPEPAQTTPGTPTAQGSDVPAPAVPGPKENEADYALR